MKTARVSREKPPKGLGQGGERIFLFCHPQPGSQIPRSPPRLLQPVTCHSQKVIKLAKV